MKEIYVIVGYERNFIGYKIQNECGRIGNVRGRPVWSSGSKKHNGWL